MYRIKLWATRGLSAVLILMALGLLGAWVRLFWFGDVFTLHSKNAKNREALASMHESLQLGASHADVLRIYWGRRERHLRLHADSPDFWVISMPSEILATEWNLEVAFQKGAVSRVRIGTGDGPPPQGGPPEKAQQVSTDHRDASP